MKGLRGERGAAAVEFAIVVVLLFMVLFGTVQFGIALHRDQGLEAAAREGARLASLGETFDAIEARVHQSQSLFQTADVDVTTTPASSGTTRPCALAGLGSFVTVTATVPELARYAITIPLWGNRLLEYSATGTFRCEQNA